LAGTAGQPVTANASGRPSSRRGSAGALRQARTSPTALAFPALAVPALGTVAWWSPLSGHAWSGPALVPGLAAWAIGVVLTLLSLHLIRPAAKRRTVADYLHGKPPGSS
jgi:hypothetical protein